MALGVAKMGRRLAYRWGKREAKKTAKGLPKQLARPLKLPAALKKEAAFSGVMHQEVLGALERMQAKNPALVQ